MVTSDLMARGVDIVNINLVINLDVPSDSSTYLHRIGRCGRFGRRGLAITLASDDTEMDKFRKLLGIIGGNKMKVATFPTTLDANTKFDAWHSEEYSDSTDSYVFGVRAEESGPTEIEAKELPNEVECQQRSVNDESDSIESRNLNLLEVARLMVDLDPNQQQPNIDLDDDLFASFQNSNGENAQPELEISENIFEEFAQVKCSSTNETELEDQIGLVLGQQENDEILPNENVSHEKKPNQTKVIETVRNLSKKSENSNIMPEKTEQNEKCHQKLSKNKNSSGTNFESTSNKHWTNLYWQQLSDINQYVINSNYLYKRMPNRQM